MKVIEYPPKAEWADALKRPTLDQATLEGKILDILHHVQTRGDAALIEYAQQWDGITLTDIRVSPSVLEAAAAQVEEPLKAAIQTAYQNIKAFHLAQQEKEIRVETMPGVTCWRKSLPIQKVGLYIPGGTAPLFSTLLMLGIPATLAGCTEIVLCTPPSKQGTIHPAILYTASLLGITTVIQAGGAQAIAAMAFGTASVPKVYKIFGPGNQYVTAAKQAVTRYGVAIDMPAGPSEVAVVADATANAAFVAADLLSQAEHGKDSQVVLITDSPSFIEAVQQSLKEQLDVLPRKEYAAAALQNSKVLLVQDLLEEGMEMMNTYAPEHLILQVSDTAAYVNRVVNAGSVFIGSYTPESAGDYASGTNHTLPTNGYATAYAGVSLDSFVRKVTFQEITPEGLQILGPVIETMAAAESLDAHKNAVSIRLQSLQK